MKQLITIILSLSVYVLHAQGITLNPVKKADKYYQEFSYAKAAEFYKISLADEDINTEYVTNQIALSYKNLNNADSSEVWFKKAVNLSSDKTINHFYLGESLMVNGKYGEAKYWFEEYQKSNPDDSRAVKKLEAIADLEQFNKALFKAEVKPVGYNSPGLDFSPAFYNNGIVFVSSRPKNGWVQKEFNWDQSRFLDLYVVDSSNEVSYYANGLNTPYHEGPLVFYNNDQSVVYTRNNYDGKKLSKDDKGVTNLKLFFAQWNETQKKWEDEKPFKYNDDNYSISSPAISNDGKVLIFSSDKQGGYGESDLYISFKEGDNWSEPQNLGEEVNTKGRDGFPFLTENQLLFASDGREGLGGLDIYSIDFIGKNVSGKVKNIGEPFNSNRDDFGLILENGAGYFTSNRNKSTSDDIYFFEVEEPRYILVKGDVFDKDLDDGINRSDVFFKNEKGEYLYTRSGKDGSYQLMAPVNSSWNVYAGKYQYELIDAIDIDIKEGDTITLDRIYLKKNYESIDSLNLPDAIPIVDTRTKPYDATSHFVDEFGEGDTLKFDIVYFDLDKSNLRNQSKDILNKASNFMIEHVDVKIILSSHTDSRASTNYNKSLSRRRSIAVERYLIDMGVNPERIEKRNLGESKLTNDCGDAEECSENQHQNNRRTEISFIKKDT